MLILAVNGLAVNVLAVNGALPLCVVSKSVLDTLHSAEKYLTDSLSVLFEVSTPSRSGTARSPEQTRASAISRSCRGPTSRARG